MLAQQLAEYPDELRVAVVVFAVELCALIAEIVVYRLDVRGVGCLAGALFQLRQDGRAFLVQGAVECLAGDFSQTRSGKAASRSGIASQLACKPLLERSAGAPDLAALARLATARAG